MYPLVCYLEWDSSFFGIRIAKTIVSSQEEIDQLFFKRNELGEKYDLIYIFSDNEKLVSVPNSILVDRKVVYSMRITGSSYFDSHIVEYYGTSLDTNILNLALASGEYSRFKVDPNFPSHSYERLYTCWIEQSIQHNIATEVFCYMADGCPRGLITLKRHNNTGDIGLVSTDLEYRGQGIGRSMLEFVKHFMYTKGCYELNVVTQYDNKAACHLYEKSGFAVKSCTNIWHWWINKTF